MTEARPNSRRRKGDDVDQCIREIKVYLEKNTRIKTDDGEEGEQELAKIPGGQQFSVLSGDDLNRLEGILNLASGRARSQIKKFKTTKPKYHEENWHEIDDQSFEREVGMSKETIKRIAKYLTIIDVRKDLGYDIETTEALILTILGIFPNTKLPDIFQNYDHPLPTVRKVIEYVIGKILETYGDLIDLGKNPLLSEEKVKQYAHAVRDRENVAIINGDNDADSSKEESTNSPLATDSEAIENKNNKDLVSEKRSHIFCSVVPVKVYIDLPEQWDNEEYFNKQHINSEAFLSYSALVGPDGIIIGLIGGIPGSSTFKELLLKTNITETMERFQYPKNDGSNKNQDSSNDKPPNTGDSQDKEEFCMYGGWLFDDIFNKKPIPQVLTVGELLRGKFGNDYRDEFALNPSTDPDDLMSNSVKFRCPKCNKGLKHDFDTHEPWSITPENRYAYREEVKHWVTERYEKDKCRLHGEDSAAWALRCISPSVVKNVSSSLFHFFPKFRYAFKTGTLGNDEIIKFLCLMKNFQRCVSDDVPLLGIKPVDLETYLQLATKNEPEILEKAQAKAVEASLFDQDRHINNLSELELSIKTGDFTDHRPYDVTFYSYYQGLLENMISRR